MNLIELALNYQQWIMLALASVGLCTIIFVIWYVLEPFLSYLVSGESHLVCSWCSVLVIAGAALTGLGLDTEQKTFFLSGVVSAACGTIIFAFYWVRKWVLWCHSK